MDGGIVSYSLDPSGNRQFETSELMRAYGALTPLAQHEQQEVAQVGTQPPWNALVAELKALRSEVQELRAAVLLIEHKPSEPDETSKLPQSTEPATWASLYDTLGD